MKKTITLIVFAAMCLMAGKATAQLSINAAYIHPEHTFNYQNENALKGMDFMNGGMLGVSHTVPLIGRLRISPGIYASYAQLKASINESSNAKFTESNINLKMPFLLSLSIPLGISTDVFVMGGPVFSMGLSALSNFVNQSTNKEVATQMDFHYDMGAALAAGIQFFRFRIFVGYNFDLNDRENITLENMESVSKAWEGSTIFAGVGVSLGSSD
jgi:hypothetical protein